MHVVCLLSYLISIYKIMFSILNATFNLGKRYDMHYISLKFTMKMILIGQLLPTDTSIYH